MKNPFSRYIFETPIFPHARTLRTSLWQKFKDSFNVLYGDLNPSFNNKEPTFGLFDVCTLGLLVPLARLTAYMRQYQNSKSNWELGLYRIIAVVNFIFNVVPRFIISALVTLVAFLPIILPIHLISSLIGRFSNSGLSTALSIKGKVGYVSEMTEETLEEALIWKHPYGGELFYKDIEDIRITRNDKESEAIFNLNRPEYFHLEIKKSQDSNHYPHPLKAVFANNIGKIANKYPVIAKQIAEELNSPMDAVVSSLLS